MRIFVYWFGEGKGVYVFRSKKVKDGLIRIRFHDR